MQCRLCPSDTTMRWLFSSPYRSFSKYSSMTVNSLEWAWIIVVQLDRRPAQASCYRPGHNVKLHLSHSKQEFLWFSWRNLEASHGGKNLPPSIYWKISVETGATMSNRGRSRRKEILQHPSFLFWLELCSPKRYVENYKPSVSKWDFIWK